MRGMVFRRYSPAMSTSDSPGEARETATAEEGSEPPSAFVRLGGGGGPGLIPNPPSRQMLGVLRVDIHGSWSIADLIKLLGQIEDAYKAAAAVEALGDRRLLGGFSSLREPKAYSGLSADELLQTVTAFQLAGGLRLGSVHYASPGWMTFIGAINPLKTVADLITANREINSKRDETRRFDEREREQHAMQHEEAMAQESRATEQQRRQHELRIARLQMDAEQARFEAMNTLLDRLPRAQQSATAADLLQRLIGTTEAIANDARVDGAKMLDQPDDATTSDVPANQGTGEPQRGGTSIYTLVDPDPRPRPRRPSDDDDYFDPKDE